MKKRKLASSLFGAAGAVLMTAGVVLCLSHLNAQPELLELPEGAKQQAEAFANALNSADLEGAGKCIYGQPDLAGESREDPIKDLARQKYQKALSCKLNDEPRGLDSGIGWDATIEVLDFEAMTEEWIAGAKAIAQMGEGTQTDSDAALYTALEQTTERKSSHTVMLKLIYRDDRWWVAADETLLRLLVGWY